MKEKKKRSVQKITDKMCRSWCLVEEEKEREGGEEEEDQGSEEKMCVVGVAVLSERLHLRPCELFF